MLINRDLLEKTYNRAWWIGIALMSSLFVEGFVVEMVRWFVPFTGFVNVEDGSPLIQYVLVMVGVSDLVFLPLLRRRLLSIRHLSSPHASVLISRLMSVTILSLAISNFPALLGLVIFLMWGNRLPFYGLWGLSLIFMLIYFPRLSFWQEWVEGGGRLEL